MNSKRVLSIALLTIVAWTLALPVAFAREVLHVPRQFDSIQAAVDAASDGDIVKVAKGSYAENVVITTPGLRLIGRKATLEGMELGGIGVHVMGVDRVRIRGFVVQHFEAGIVLENTRLGWVFGNELRGNRSTTDSLRDGIQLVDAHHNIVAHNFAHDNGHNGITLKLGSSNNGLHGNVSSDNGLDVTENFGGCGIQLIGGGNDSNFIARNTTERNGWGIQMGPDSNHNTVLSNRSHENARAGVVVLDSGRRNYIAKNKATGNGVANVAPSGKFDLFDQGLLDNLWVKNRGTSNF